MTRNVSVTDGVKRNRVADVNLAAPEIGGIEKGRGGGGIELGDEAVRKTSAVPPLECSGSRGEIDGVCRTRDVGVCSTSP